MSVSEPMTVVTDAALAAASFAFGFRLAHAAKDRRQRSIALWSVALVAGGAAALIGGIYHGVGVEVSTWTSTILWKGTVWLLGISALASLLGSVTAVVPASRRALLTGVVWAKLALYLVWTARHDDFRYVVYDQLTAMVGILLLHAFGSGSSPSRRFMVAAVVASLVAAALQQSGIDLHKSFNHNDLFHVAQIGANYLFYRGALLIRDREMIP